MPRVTYIEFRRTSLSRMTAPQGGGGREGPPAHGHGHAVGSYANIAGKQDRGRKKLNVLDIMLERKDNSISYNMSKEELSKLLFSKMKLDPKTVLVIDTSGFGRIHVELSTNVNPEHLVTLPAFDIREGLRTKYYKPHHRKESLITVNWMDIETPDDLLIHILNHFGQVKSNVKWTKIKEEEGESELAKLLNNIPNGERQIWIEVKKPIPSYAMIDKRKVKIYHPGQRRTCARCQKVADLCKGNSNAKLCEENGGEKTNVAEAWKNTLSAVGYTEWSGGEVEINVAEVVVDEPEEENTADVTNCDGFVISNLEEDATLEDIKAIMKEVVPEDALERITVHPTGSIRSKIIKDVDIALVNHITKKVDNKSYKGRLLHCRPHVPVTPPKKDPVQSSIKEPEIIAEVDTVKPSTTEAKETGEPKTPVKEKSILEKQSTIPGLLQAEIEKALKKKETQKKKQERRKKKVENKANETNTPLDSTSISEHLSQEFVFTEATVDDDKDEAFEDTVEEVNEFMTPKTFKSDFAKKVEAKMTPIQTPKRAASFADLSPIEPNDVKKPKSTKPPTVRKSSLPRAPGKH